MLTKKKCKDALGQLDLNCWDCEYACDMSDDKPCVLKEIIGKLINEHFDNPKISLEIETSDWIPCKERMPKDSRNVVITTYSNVVGVGSYLGNGWVQWYSGGGMAVDVLAWRELPKPYDEVQENE